MTKLTKYLVIIAGLVLLFHFSGLTTQCGEDGLCQSQTPSSVLLNLLLNIKNLPETGLSSFTNKGIAILEGIVAAAIIVGAIAFRNPELVLVGSYTILLFNLGWDILYVFLVIANLNIVIALLLFSPIMIVFLPTIIEWWRGVTT